MGGPHTKTRRHSKVNQLPSELQSSVDRLLIEGATYEEIEVFLKQQGHEIGKSSIGRYGKRYLNFYQRVRMIEDQAKQINSNAGEGLSLEEAASKAFTSEVLDTLIDIGIDKEKGAKQLPKLMLAFSALQSSSVSREKFKADIQRRVAKTAEDVTKIAKKNGLSDDTAAQIREKILGIGK